MANNGLLYQPQLTPQVLQQGGNVPLDMTLENLGAQQRMQQADQMSLANLPAAYAHQQAMYPLEQEQTRAQTAEMNARAPLYQAQADEMSLRTKREKSTFDSDVAAALAKNGAAVVQSHANNMLSHGQLAMNAADLIDSNPVGGVQKAKEILGKSGFWNDSFDSMPPQQLSQNLRKVGEGIISSGQKIQFAIRQNEARLQRESMMEELKARHKMELQQQRLGVAQQMKLWELQNRRELDKPTYQGLSARYSEMARQAYAAGEMEEGRQYDAEAQRMNQAAMALPAVGPNTANQGKPDITAVTGGAVPTVNPGRATNAQAGGLPPRGQLGTKDNPIKLD